MDFTEQQFDPCKGTGLFRGLSTVLVNDDILCSSSVPIAACYTS